MQIESAKREKGENPWSGQMSCRLVYTEESEREALRQYVRYVHFGPLAVQFVLASLAIVLFQYLEFWHQSGRVGKVSTVGVVLYWMFAGLWLARAIWREHRFARSMGRMRSSTRLTLQPRRNRIYLQSEGDELGRYLAWDSVDRVAITRDFIYLLTSGRVRAFFPCEQLPRGMREYLMQKRCGFWQQPAAESYREI